MVNAGRVAMAWITVIIVLVVCLLLMTVLSPQVEIWQQVVVETLTRFGVINYDSAVNLVWIGFRVFPVIICGCIIVWAVLTSLSEEFQSDLGDL